MEKSKRKTSDMILPQILGMGRAVGVEAWLPGPVRPPRMILGHRRVRRVPLFLSPMAQALVLVCL